MIPCELLHYHRGRQLQSHMLGAHRGGNLGYIITVPVGLPAHHPPFPTKPRHTVLASYTL